MMLQVIWVIMAVHNRVELTVRALESLLAVDLPNYRLRCVVFDDGSTDGTATALAQLSVEITVIRGDGSAFWARGMATAENFVLKRAATRDIILWMNDDVALYDGSIEAMTVALEEHESRIVVGATADSATGAINYSGYLRGRWNPMRVRTIEPLPGSRMDTFNGNVVMMSLATANSVGGIDGRFGHGLADIDYGLRASALGHCIILWGVAGTCLTNPPVRTGRVVTDWARFTSRKGGGHLPSLWRFLHRHAGRRSPILVGELYLSWWLKEAGFLVARLRTSNSET